MYKDKNLKMGCASDLLRPAYYLRSETRANAFAMMEIQRQRNDEATMLLGLEALTLCTYFEEPKERLVAITKAQALSSDPKPILNRIRKRGGSAEFKRLAHIEETLSENTTRHEKYMRDVIHKLENLKSEPRWYWKKKAKKKVDVQEAWMEHVRKNLGLLWSWRSLMGFPPTQFEKEMDGIVQCSYSAVDCLKALAFSN